VASKTSVCRGQSFTITASGASSYSWNTGATSSSLVTSSTLVANVNYTVSGTDANGCSNATVITIKVNSCIGIEEWTTGDVKFYPNPTQDIITIELPNAHCTVTLLDINGRILEQSKNQLKTNFMVSKYAKGVYILKVSDLNTIQSYKFFKD
jgi:hypothetical protein